MIINNVRMHASTKCSLHLSKSSSSEVSSTCFSRDWFSFPEPVSVSDSSGLCAGSALEDSELPRAGRLCFFKLLRNWNKGKRQALMRPLEMSLMWMMYNHNTSITPSLQLCPDHHLGPSPAFRRLSETAIQCRDPSPHEVWKATDQHLSTETKPNHTRGKH